jgi:hypothetical protein
MQPRKQSWLDKGPVEWFWGTADKNKHQYGRQTHLRTFIFLIDLIQPIKANFITFLDTWIMIVGGIAYSATGTGVSNLNSVELFNLRTNQSSSFGILNNPVSRHVGGLMNGTPFYCGGDSTLASPEGSCFKFNLSWKKVIIISYCYWFWFCAALANKIDNVEKYKYKFQINFKKISKNFKKLLWIQMPIKYSIIL